MIGDAVFQTFYFENLLVLHFAKRYTNAWIMLTSLRKMIVFDLLKVTKSGGWNRHRIQGGGISVLPSCFLRLTGEWKREKKNYRSLSQSGPVFTLNTKTGGSSALQGWGLFLGEVIISFLEDIRTQLLCALSSSRSIPGIHAGGKGSEKAPVGADLPSSVRSDRWRLWVVMVPGQVWQSLRCLPRWAALVLSIPVPVLVASYITL